jgi:arylsulfatase A-like enzyme
VTWSYDGPLIEAGRMTVTSLLQEHGYTTACFGKWHLGWTAARRGGAQHARSTSEKCRRYLLAAALVDVEPYTKRLCFGDDGFRRNLTLTD